MDKRQFSNKIKALIAEVSKLDLPAVKKTELLDNLILIELEISNVFDEKNEYGSSSWESSGC